MTDLFVTFYELPSILEIYMSLASRVYVLEALLFHISLKHSNLNFKQL